MAQRQPSVRDRKDLSGRAHNMPGLGTHSERPSMAAQNSRAGHAHFKVGVSVWCAKDGLKWDLSLGTCYY